MCLILRWCVDVVGYYVFLLLLSLSLCCRCFCRVFFLLCCVCLSFAVSSFNAFVVLVFQLFFFIVLFPSSLVSFVRLFVVSVVFVLCVLCGSFFRV